MPTTTLLKYGLYGGKQDPGAIGVLDSNSSLNNGLEMPILGFGVFQTKTKGEIVQKQRPCFTGKFFTKHFGGCLALALLGATAVADDWPQWQGPDRTAVSKEKGLLKEWPKDGPPLAWKANGIGEGMGGVGHQRRPDLHHRRQRRLGLALCAQRVGRQASLEGEDRARRQTRKGMPIPHRPARHADRRRRPALRPRPARRPRLLHDRGQGSLAHGLRQGLWRHRPGLGLIRVAAG